MPPLAAILDRLEKHHGLPSPEWPLDPYHFLVWLHCGYPASTAACDKGWQSLRQSVGLSPPEILATSARKLASILKAGGLIPRERAVRLHTIARRTRDEFAGDLNAALSAMPVALARKTLKSFPGIGTPGADRILLFAGFSNVPAIPSNCPDVLVRIVDGGADSAYTRIYRRAQALLEEARLDRQAAQRAYLLLKRHGESVCKSSRPRCELCPLTSGCAYFAQASRR